VGLCLFAASLNDRDSLSLQLKILTFVRFLIVFVSIMMLIFNESYFSIVCQCLIEFVSVHITYLYYSK